jgi:hypothetical protein
MLTVTNYPVGWNALHSELKVNFQRKDIDINHISVIPGNPNQVIVKYNLNAFDFIGKTIYINSGNYVGNYVVDSQSDWGSETWLYILTSPIGNSTGGYMISDDLCPSYKVDVLIYKGDGTYITIMQPSPFTDGTCFQELSGILSKNINQFPTSELSSFSGKSDIYEEFYLMYRENYTGAPGGYTTGGKFYGVNAVFQDGTLNDGTLNNFIPNISDAYAVTKGKFLQMFEMPVMNVFQDFLLYFVWDGGYTKNYPLTLYVNYLDVNKAVISSYSSLLNDASAGYLCAVSLSGLVIPDTACYLDAYIQVGTTQIRCLELDTVEPGCVDPVLSTVTAQKLIDSLIIKLDRTNKHVTPIRYLNFMGGLSQWTFTNKYYLNNENKDNKYIVGNDGTKLSNIYVTSNSKENIISVGAENITLDQWNELSNINIPQMLIGATWQNVAVKHKNDEIAIDEVYIREMTFLKNPLKSHKH